MKLTTPGNEFFTNDLNELRAQLEAWRRKQPGRARLPEAIWRSAATLARDLGISRVSRALRLNYYKLNRRTARAAGCPQDLATKTTFVELSMDGPKGSNGNHGYRVEMSDATTDKLTLDLGGDVKAVVALAESFWRRNR